MGTFPSRTPWAILCTQSTTHARISRKTFWARVLLVCVLTPLHALAVITLIVCMPLAPRTQGPDTASWIRLFITTIIIVAGPAYHFRCCIPSLPMSFCHAYAVSFAASIGGVAFAYGVTQWLGFPIPVTSIVQSLIVLPILTGSLNTLWRRTLRETPSLSRDLRQQIFALLGQVSMICVYPLYFFAFTPMPSVGQSIFTFLLPMIKLAFKNYFSRLLHQLHDVKPVFIVFNAEVFSALYVVNCLQASRSGVNLLLVMLVDIEQTRRRPAVARTLGYPRSDVAKTLTSLPSAVFLSIFSIKWFYGSH